MFNRAWLPTVAAAGLIFGHGIHGGLWIEQSQAPGPGAAATASGPGARGDAESPSRPIPLPF